MTISPASTTLAIEKVWPEKIHVYPGEANPIEVTVRNYEARPAKAVVRLEIRTGLDQSSPPMEATLDVPAGGTVKHRFPWTAGEVSFGHEARATVLNASQPVHAASEYFSVGAPIWKTAMQGSGFLTWFGREFQFPEHVETNRLHYINVEEAFSWQPSSWTDLNPTTEDWWTGQGNAHNSLRGLRQWMDLSHREGIKLITYSWPSASGPSGIEWGRRHPELVTHVGGRPRERIPRYRGPQALRSPAHEHRLQGIALRSLARLWDQSRLSEDDRSRRDGDRQIRAELRLGRRPLRFAARLERDGRRGNARGNAADGRGGQASPRSFPSTWP